MGIASSRLCGCEAQIGTHSGDFQADEALGVWMLRQLPQFKGSPVRRTRNKSELQDMVIVIDVGGVYDHKTLRYDHHQRGFFETFDGENEQACDSGRQDVKGPEDATGEFKTKLSASGLLYKHYGREILSALHPSLAHSPAQLDWAYNKMYRDFMEAIDAFDNGVEVADERRYFEGSSLSVRVRRMNVRWNASGGPTEDELFEKASAMCGVDFSDALADIVLSQLPARSLVESALERRMQVHSSGEVIFLSIGGSPWATHLYDLERELRIEKLIKFVVYEDKEGLWRIRAVTAEGTSFTNRLGLLEPWRGLQGDELSKVADIPGCTFVHASGFIGGNSTYEGAVRMADLTLQAAG